MNLSVELISAVSDLSNSDIATWNRLAATPFQRWEWLGTWWDAYQANHQLHILAIKRDGQTIAFAPWFLEKRVSTGRTIQFLGSGKVCSDHLSLLVDEPDQASVCDAIADWLVDVIDTNPTNVPKHLLWDSIELIGVDQDDPSINRLVQSTQQLGLDVERTEGMGCYAIDLPSQWDDYVGQRSKSGRRELRQSLKNVEDGKLSIVRATTEQDLETMWDQFVTLHQRRRHASGTTGCFDHPPFDTFLRNAATQLLNADLLEMTLAYIDGIPVAAQFALVDDQTWYFYQSGMEPDAANVRPGMSLFCHSIRRTIETGRQKFDMMRGDEPYKLRWRAKLQPTQEVRVCSPKNLAQLRHQIFTAGMSFKGILKNTFAIPTS